MRKIHVKIKKPNFSSSNRPQANLCFLATRLLFSLRYRARYIYIYLLDRSAVTRYRTMSQEHTVHV